MLLDNRPDIHRKFQPMPGDLVEVTWLDIFQGLCEDPEECMVAKALERRYGGTWSVHGDEAEYTSADRKDWRRFKLPKKAESQIERFDDDKKVKPFTFKLGREMRDRGY